MSPTSLKAWRQSLNLSQRKASEALGISERMYIYYERGHREDGREAPIPKTVALACAAVSAGLAPAGDDE